MELSFSPVSHWEETPPHYSLPQGSPRFHLSCTETLLETFGTHRVGYWMLGWRLLVRCGTQLSRPGQLNAESCVGVGAVAGSFAVFVDGLAGAVAVFGDCLVGSDAVAF